MDMMLIIQFLVLTVVVSGVLIFFLKKTLFDSTQGAVNRLNRETEEVRAQQAELKEKIKQANEELERRRKEADELVTRMTEEAEAQANEARNKLVNKARAESEEILAKAQKSKDDLRKVIEKETEMKIVDFSSELLKVVLGQKTQDVLHESLITEFLDNLEKVDMSVVTEEGDVAELITATKVDNGMIDKLKGILKGKLNRDVEVKIAEDPNIISGAVLKLGSLSLDGSLAYMLEEEGILLKEKLEKTT